VHPDVLEAYTRGIVLSPAAARRGLSADEQAVVALLQRMRAPRRNWPATAVA
jgi:hypothetical protein